MENLRLGVSDCIAYINQTLEYAYPSVVVVGEVSSFKVNQGKYVFFDLKDEQASLGCFMMIYQLRQPIEDGMKVEVVAQPKLTAWGKFSLTVREVRPVGEGSLKRAFELLVKKLQKEGLFDATRKRSLPVMPSRIGVITSTQAAGYTDFIRILNDRWGGVNIEVAHVQVQGAVASQQIQRALAYFNEAAEPPEVIAIVRGGGSADDLASFNDEPLARAIAASRVPVIVGVGHENDITLADMVADVRAATPSNAAQLLVPDREAILKAQHRELSRASTQLVRSFQKQRALVLEAQRVMLGCIARQLTLVKQSHKAAQRTLIELNPRRILQRGYALIKNETQVIRDGSQVKIGETVSIELEKTIIEAGVKHVYQK
jgi:exodeoxyribonuclease VII large subunit